MLENHSHPVLRHRRIPVKQSPPSIIPVPVEVASTPEPVQEPALPPPPPAPRPVAKPAPSTSPHVDISLYVTCIIVNFKTRKLVKRALTSFLNFYPDVHITLVDNGSGDKSTSYIRQAGKAYPKVHAVLHNENIGHGPAMHEAILAAGTDYVFTLDSDCTVERGGFLERMLERAMANDLYAIGWRRWVDRLTGVATREEGSRNPNKGKFVAYVHPCAALYNRSMYGQLPPFGYYGAPCVLNMRAAAKREFAVCTFPIFQYVTHLKAGTRRMYGGRWNPKEGEKAKAWTEGKDWPI